MIQDTLIFFRRCFRLYKQRYASFRLFFAASLLFSAAYAADIFAVAAADAARYFAATLLLPRYATLMLLDIDMMPHCYVAADYADMIPRQISWVNMNINGI